MKKLSHLTCWVYLVCLTFTSLHGQESRTLRLTVYSPGLQGNLLGDSPHRELVVYLPPSYQTAKDRRYPVLYVIHGNNASLRPQDLNKFYGVPIAEIMDPLIAQGKIQELIVVFPDSKNAYGGSQYANSSMSGNWADFIVKDVVGYMDENYRTLAKAGSRGLTGHSMGGRGTLYLPLKYPGIFGVVYATSPGQMGFHKSEIGTEAIWRHLLTSKNPIPEDNNQRRILGFSIAFAPNPNHPPYYADFSFALKNEKLVPVPEVMAKWARFDPVQMIERNADPYRNLNAFHFDCGIHDRIIDSARLFSKKLDELNVSHVFEEYEGGHNDKKNERFLSKVLPMFAKHLKFE